MEASFASRDRVGVSDLVMLEDYTSQDAVIENLRKRFTESLIYTYIGPVVVSVNPYRELNIYDESTIQLYRNVSYYELPAHVYALAAVANRCMIAEHRDQCVLISGESGAGKTEASKKILQYVAGTSRHTEKVDQVRDRLLLSNPVLEAFGNAKTTRNDNSSRFGKYMDVQFSFTGEPVGGHVLEYLLEKGRVVKQAPGDRNFHIFYQLLQGSDSSRLRELGLSSDPDSYVYLNQGGSSRVNSLPDADDFRSVLEAMKTCDFSDHEVQSLLSIVAGVLLLGNMQFGTDGTGNAVLPETPEVQHLAKLFGCDLDVFIKSLTHRSIQVNFEMVSSPLTEDQALYVKDSLAKGVYDRMFSWLVGRINESLESHVHGPKMLFGLLDIYGFEVFEHNSFEQLCINYCNEKLQQLFIELTLKSEQEEYQTEGIEWEPVEYFNNKIICDLIESKPIGIIALMDEECLRPGKATDATLMTKMSEMITHNKHIRLPTTGVKGLQKHEFNILHYAGEVQYDITGFLDKNNDLFFRDLKEALSGSDNPVLDSCFPADEIKNKKRPLTAATQFKKSLGELMVILMSKEPSYVRCIKPNNNKSSTQFDVELVRHQVKYLGLLENLRVRRAGFAYRREHKIFLNRYKPLCEETWPVYRGADSDGVLVLMNHLNVKQEEFRLGRSKVFIRYPRTLFEIEDLLQVRKNDIAIIMQRRIRGFVKRNKFLRMRRAVTMITSHFRRMKAQREAARRRWATLLIRQFVKGFQMRNAPPCKENALFVRLTRISFLADLSRKLPRNVLDKSWPKPPPLCEQASEQLRVLHRRNQVRGYVRNLTSERKAQLELKCVTERIFKGRKSSYEPSVPQPFVQSRLDAHESQVFNSVFINKIKSPSEHVKYCSHTTKYDRHGFKARGRLLVLTEKCLYTLHDKDGKLKDRLPLEKILGLEVSRLLDGFLVLHVSATDEQNGIKGDLVLDAGRHCMELITWMITCAPQLEEKIVIADSPIECRQIDGQTTGIINITRGVAFTVKARAKELLVTTSA